MADLLSSSYTLLLLGDVVALFLYHMMHSSFYRKRPFFENRKILVFIIYTLSCLAFFGLNLLGIIWVNIAASIAFFLVPLFICYKVNNVRGIIYFLFYIAAQSAIEIGITLGVSGVRKANVSNMEYEWMNPATSGVIHMLSIIVAKVICIFGNKDSDRKLDKAALPYVVLPVFSVLFFMVDGNRFLQGDNEYNLSQYTEIVVILVLINILVFAFLEKHTALMKQEIEARQNEYKLKSDAYIMSLATRTMKERLAVSEEIMQQDRAMRHDRRHFEALLQSLLLDGKSQEALECLNERLKQEPHSVKRYCENTTINAAITHYVSAAERDNIRIEVSTSIPAGLSVDETQFAITICNLIENAIHACREVPENERFISITAKYKSQLLFEIANSCAEKVRLNEEGHPFNFKEGHGIGTRSVLAFVDQTGGDIRYISEDRVFKVRMIVG